MLEAAVIAAMTACASFNMIYYYDVCQPNGVNNISKPLQVLRTDNFEQFSTLCYKVSEASVGSEVKNALEDLSLPYNSTFPYMGAGFRILFISSR